MEVGSQLALLPAPVLRMGKRVGNVYVAASEAGRGFGHEDEETLTIFTSQAAYVISNARRRRDERRGRADLEALIETPPIGVVVFGGRRESPFSVNREV